MAITLVPTYDFEKGPAAALKHEAFRNVQILASKLGGASTADIVARDLNATDLMDGPTQAALTGATQHAAVTNTSALTLNTWLDSVFPNLVMGTQQAVVLYGWQYLSPTPHIKQIRFWRGNMAYARLALQQLYGTPDTTMGYFSELLYWSPNDTPRIDLLADAAVAQNGEEFMPLGFIAEPAGITVVDTTDLLSNLGVKQSDINAFLAAQRAA